MKNDSISRDDIKSLEAEIPRELESVIDRQNWILDAIKNKIIANVSLKNESAKAQLVPLQVEEVDSPNSFKFTNDEVLFFIAREIINIKSNASFLRIITKVSYVATICFILQASISLSLGLVFMAASISLYLIVERACRANFDLDAVSLLEEYYKDAPDNGNLSPQERALNAGKMAIEKLIDQNTQRREKNEICRLYITEGGDNLLDLLNPLLTSRLNNLQGMA